MLLFSPFTMFKWAMLWAVALVAVGWYMFSQQGFLLTNRNHFVFQYIEKKYHQQAVIDHKKPWDQVNMNEVFSVHFKSNQKVKFDVVDKGFLFPDFSDTYNKTTKAGGPHS